MRRSAAILVLLATCGMLGACGKGEPAMRTVTATATVPSAHAGGSAQGGGTEPQAHAGDSSTKAQALAFAHAVNLQAVDVPDFRLSSEREHEHESAREKQLGVQMVRCVGSAVPTGSLGSLAAGVGSHVAQASSKKYERSAGLASQSVTSEVTVERTAAEAAGVLAALRNARVRECLSRYVRLVFEGGQLQGATIGPVSVKYGSPPAPGTTGSFGLRFSASISTHGVHIPFYLDLLGFVDGPAQVSLVTTGIPLPLPAKIEEQLFSLLLERAKAHTP
jgi:hypothetical protein